MKQTFVYCYLLFIFFIDESVLLDLKHLLMEAKQKVPPFLAALQSENEKYLDVGGKLIFIICESLHFILAQKKKHLFYLSAFFIVECCFLRNVRLFYLIT